MENSIGGILIILAKTAAAFIALVAGVYVWVLPEFFSGYKTYLFFYLGILGAAAFSGFKCFLALGNESAVAKLFLSLLCAVVAATLVAVASLLIILNLRGS